MTKEEYKSEGFKMSLVIEQPEIDRAEADVIDAYIRPIVGDAEVVGAVRIAVMNLAFLRLTQTNISATRAGAKVKLTTQSNAPSAWDVIAEQSKTCHYSLEQLRQLEGANKSAEVTDICSIYFKSNYFYI